DSDQWDGSKVGGTLADGGNAPGGAMSITEDGVTFLRIQDTGDPRIAGFTDPTNRKVYFGHNISDDGGSDNLMDDGVTLTFQAPANSAVWSWIRPSGMSFGSPSRPIRRASARTRSPYIWTVPRRGPTSWSRRGTAMTTPAPATWLWARAEP